MPRIPRTALAKIPEPKEALEPAAELLLAALDAADEAAFVAEERIEPAALVTEPTLEAPEDATELTEPAALDAALEADPVAEAIVVAPETNRTC